MNNYRKHFSKIAVLGTGTMGSQIAAHLVNCSCDCLLFGLTAEEDKNATAEVAIKRLAKINPAPLVAKDLAKFIIPCDYTNDLPRLKECSLVIEAVSEDLKVKHELYDKLVPHLNDDAIFASNTSGIRIKELAEALPSDKKDNFCGIHFFNPPRYMPLVELIAHPGTDQNHLYKLEGFLTAVLGKQVVYAKDVPGFIANRIGIFSMSSIFHWMDHYKLAPDTVDELCGSLIGRAKSACFRTADIVGLDIMSNVMKNLNDNLDYDPWREYFVLPDWLQGIIKQGHLGQKSGKGVYEKTPKEIVVFDPATGDYRPVKKSKSKQVKEILSSSKSLAEALPKLRAAKDDQANFLWTVHRETFHYSALYLAELADNASDLDQAMMSGFGWEQGVFRLWQEAGIHKIYNLIEEDIKQGKTIVRLELPDWAKQDIYNESGAWAPSRKARVMPSSHPVYKRQIIANKHHLWPGQKRALPDVIMEDESIRMIDLKDGVAAINFKTKMNTISFELLQSCAKALDLVDNEYRGLIFCQPDPPFCAGANIYQILAGVRLGKIEKGGVISSVKQAAFEAMNPKLPKLGNLPPIRRVINDLQDLYMRLKHANFPVVAAVQGLALGGGCELLLHTDRVVATNDSFIGLVEMGIGVLPAGGGTKEMARRADELSQGLDDWAHFLYLKKYYGNIAMAKVATSASEARDMGYLRPTDKIISNPKELLYISKRECLALIDESYTPPRRSTDIRVGGRPAIANFLAHTTNLKEGGFISDHDYLCAKELAYVLCGGDLDKGERASDEWFINLERDGFIKLLSTKLTQDRIEHTLKTGKPLRN